MAIVSAAIAAVTAAVVSTSVATVATAAIAVGTLVGTVGLGLSVIGSVTGNKTLSKIGNYMGMAGGVMGLAGGLAGGMAGYAKTLSTAWDDGVGSLFSNTKAVGQAGLQQEALGRGIVSATNPQAGAAFQKAGLTTAGNIQEQLGQGIVAGTRMPASTATQPTALAPGIDTGYVSKLASTPENIQLAKQASDIQAIANANPVASVAPSAPSSTAPLVANTMQAAKPAVEHGMQQVNQPNQRPDANSFWGSLPDWAKAQIAISGAQGAAGLLGGWFEGATAEEKLELERQAQQWRMQHEDRTQAFQQKNASYAPLVQFGGGGMLNRGA